MSRRARSCPAKRLLLIATVAMASACGSTVQTGNTAEIANGPVDGGVSGPGSSRTQRSGQVAGAAGAVTSEGASVGASVGAGGPGAPGAADDGAVGPMPADAAPGQAVARRPPVSIGVLGAGSFQGAAQSAGFDAGTSTSGDQAMKAVLRHFKERGGIGGRQVRAVFSTVEPTEPNYETALAAECARFTQDNKVDVLLSNIGFYNDSFEACLSARSLPHVEGGWGLTDDAELRRYPNYYLPAMPSYDARFATLLASGIASGQLPRGLRVGVVVEDCPWIQRAFGAQWLPRSRAAGLVLDEFHVKCTAGAEDAGPLAQQMQAAQLRFRSNDVQLVMFATYPTEVNVLLFATAAQSQRWFPRYYLDSKARVADGHSTGNYPIEQVRNMRGVGWAPAMDVSVPALTTSAQKRCLAIMTESQVTIKTPLDAQLAFSACDPFFLLEAALSNLQGPLQASTFRSSVELLGTRFAAAGNGARTLLSRRHHYGTLEYATFGFNAGCDCVRYTSRYRAW
jgi:hypothetical protein